MNRFVALYRGINVGGNNPVNMGRLRAMHETLGHRAVASYIQSGNLVFEAEGPATTLASQTAAAFVEHFGFPARVLVVTAAEWKTTAEANPYAECAAKLPQLVHMGVCDGKPSVSGLKALSDKTDGAETFVVQSRFIYLHAPDGVGNSKFAAGLEKAAGVPVTMRNWRTVEALTQMLEGPGGDA